MAPDTNGVKDAGPWITAAHPTYTALIDEKHLVSKLYNMVNVPTGAWIDEHGKIVRPNEVAFVDDRFKNFSGLDSAPYLNALTDWVEKGDKSSYVMSEERLREKLTANNSEIALAAAEFGLGEHLYKSGHLTEAIPHFKEAAALESEELELQASSLRALRCQARLWNNLHGRSPEGRRKQSVLLTSRSEARAHAKRQKAMRRSEVGTGKEQQG